MSDRTTPGDDKETEPRRLRQLRQLVTILTMTLIIGIIVVVGLLVIRLANFGSADLPLPAEIRLPAGERARAVTLGSSWVAVVTVDGSGLERVRILDRNTGAGRGEIEIHPQD